MEEYTQQQQQGHKNAFVIACQTHVYAHRELANDDDTMSPQKALCVLVCVCDLGW